MNYTEFRYLVTPKDQPYKGLIGQSYGTIEERKLQQLSWLESLNELFLAILRVEDDLSYEREKHQLNGERIFEDIDSQRVGYIYTNKLSQWINSNCGFQLVSDDAAYIHAGLSKGDQHVIRRDDFLKSVNADKSSQAEVAERSSSVAPEEEEQQ